jgi:hypothetical protein
MKPLPGMIGPEDFLFDDDSRELLEGMEGASVQEKLVDTDFFNRFEVRWLWQCVCLSQRAWAAAIGHRVKLRSCMCWCLRCQLGRMTAAQA